MKLIEKSNQDVLQAAKDMLDLSEQEVKEKYSCVDSWVNADMRILLDCMHSYVTDTSIDKQKELWKWYSRHELRYSVPQHQVKHVQQVKSDNKNMLWVVLAVAAIGLSIGIGTANKASANTDLTTISYCIDK